MLSETDFVNSEWLGVVGKSGILLTWLQVSLAFFFFVRLLEFPFQAQKHRPLASWHSWLCAKARPIHLPYCHGACLGNIACHRPKSLFYAWHFFKMWVLDILSQILRLAEQALYWQNISIEPRIWELNGVINKNRKMWYNFSTISIQTWEVFARHSWFPTHPLILNEFRY